MASNDFNYYYIEQSNIASWFDGAPLFTITQSLKKSKKNDALTSEGGNSVMAILETLFL